MVKKKIFIPLVLIILIILIILIMLNKTIILAEAGSKILVIDDNNNIVKILDPGLHSKALFGKKEYKKYNIKPQGATYKYLINNKEYKFDLVYTITDLNYWYENEINFNLEEYIEDALISFINNNEASIEDPTKFLYYIKEKLDKDKIGITINRNGMIKDNVFFNKG